MTWINNFAHLVSYKKFVYYFLSSVNRQWCYPSLSCFWVRGLNCLMHNDKNSFVALGVSTASGLRKMSETDDQNTQSHSIHVSLLKGFKDSDLNITLPYMIILTRDAGHRHWPLTWKLLSQIWMCLWESGVTDESKDDESDESECIVGTAPYLVWTAVSSVVEQVMSRLSAATLSNQPKERKLASLKPHLFGLVGLNLGFDNCIVKRKH